MHTYTPLHKQSKRQQKAYYAQKRGSWQGVCPVTRRAPNPQAYDRRQLKAELRQEHGFD